MIAQENKYINGSGVFPAFQMIDASGVGTTDGSEFTALPQNDGWEAVSQALMAYAAGGTNQPTGSVGVPNGVSEANGISQIIEAMHKAFGIGPGTLKIWMKNQDPSLTGDRVLLLQGQGVLIATYPDLDAATYVGNANNAAVAAGGGSGLSRGAFYRASDSAGTIPNTAGPYLILPESRGYAMRVLDALASVDPQGALRFLGDNQADAMQRITGSVNNTMRVTAATSLFNTYSGALSDNGALNTSYPSALAGPASSNDGLSFDNSGSTSPNTAKTDDVETRAANMSIQLGITY